MTENREGRDWRVEWRSNILGYRHKCKLGAAAVVGGKRSCIGGRKSMGGKQAGAPSNCRSRVGGTAKCGLRVALSQD